MAWRDELQAASFRGVAFKVNTSDLQSGRRVVEHEYPQRDLPYGEDLGRKARTFSFEAFVLGADYLSQKNALLEACETQGPGELIHPYFGSRQVLCTSVRIREAINEGGVARFSLAFNEAGLEVFPKATTDLPLVVDQAADKTLVSIESAFANDFSVLKQPQFVLDQAVAFMQTGVTQVETLAGSILNPVTDLQQSINDFKTGLNDLLTTPERLVKRYRQIQGAVSGSLSRNIESINVLQVIASSQQPDNSVPILTPSRIKAQENQSALNQMIQSMALVEAVRLASRAVFDSYEQAIQTREQLMTVFDELMLDISDEVFLNMQALRSVFAQALPKPDESLPRLIQYTPAQTLPALVIAYELYGDASRAQDIIKRNKTKIRHPGFVAAAEPLEILVDV